MKQLTDSQRFIAIATLILLLGLVLRVEDLHRYPPGPHYDESANVLITRSIALDGANLFPIVNSYQGRESLYFYLAAPLFRFVHDDVFSLRILSVFCNLITIAASMALGREMFGEKRGVWIGLIAGALMAVNFHQIFMSRQAYRAVTLPMMQALGLLFLWRGLNHRRHRALWLILGGAFSAGALYTYMASRLFPVWLALAGLALLVADRAHWRARLGQGVIFFGSMALFALPITIYALENPDIFFQRLTEVQAGEITVPLAESIRLHAEMFFLHGDFGNLRYNIPGRPYFTLIEAPFLLIGLAIALRGVFRAKNAAQSAAGYLLIAFAPLMVIPSVISLAGSPPNHMRSLGMVPLIFLMVALGVEWAARQISPRVVLAGLTVGVMALAFLVRGDYRAWAGRTDLFVQADGDLALAAEWLSARATDQPVYVSSYHRQHPTILRAYDRSVTWLGLDSLILPPPGTEGLVIFSHDYPPTAAWLDYLRPLDEPLPTLPDGSPAFSAYSVRAREDLPDQPIAQNAYIALLNVISPPIPSGETDTVTLVWRVLQDMPYRALRPVLKLSDPSGIMLSTSDPYLLDTQTWRAGETILQNVRVSVPPATPQGDYALSMTWVDRDTGLYLQYVDTEGESAGINADVAEVKVAAPLVPPTVAPEIVYGEIVAPGVRLLGWDTPPNERRPGESITLSLYWEATSATTRADFDLALTLGDHTLASQALTRPPSQWAVGEINHSYHSWRVPLDMPDGDHTISLKLDKNNIAVVTVRIAGQSRLTEAPPVDQLVNVVFEDQIALYGYTLTENEDALTLDLVWQALREIPHDYTVFVHLVDENGEILDQVDAMPQNYGYPTSLWAEGEFVPDRIVFSSPPQNYAAILLGWYDQSNSIRLYISNASTGIINDTIEIVSER